MERRRGYEIACADLGEYAGGDTSKLAVGVIDATVNSYIEELIEARQERVIELQCYIRQLRALRVVLAGGGGTPQI